MLCYFIWYEFTKKAADQTNHATYPDAVQPIQAEEKEAHEASQELR